MLEFTAVQNIATSFLSALRLSICANTTWIGNHLKSCSRLWSATFHSPAILWPYILPSDSWCAAALKLQPEMLAYIGLCCHLSEEFCPRYLHIPFPFCEAVLQSAGFPRTRCFFPVSTTLSREQKSGVRPMSRRLSAEFLSSSGARHLRMYVIIPYLENFKGPLTSTRHSA